MKLTVAQITVEADTLELIDALIERIGKLGNVTPASTSASLAIGAKGNVVRRVRLTDEEKAINSEREKNGQAPMTRDGVIARRASLGQTEATGGDDEGHAFEGEIDLDAPVPLD